ncbi:DnaB-like helicase C-terminal domain-containing protein [Wolbachia endosymbiont of Protocalliphora sialia]
MTGGFKEGELSVLAARTSIGKTSIALHMALEAIMHPFV